MQDTAALWRQLRQAAEAAPHWGERLEEAIYRTLSSALSHLQIGQDEFKQLLEKSGNGKTVFAHAFEQFSTEYSDDAGQSFIEEYVQRHGDALSAAEGAYLRALPATAPRLWQVHDVTASGKCIVADADEPDGAVHSVPAGANAVAGQYLLARLVPVEQEAHFGVSVLSLTAEDAAEVSAMMRQTKDDIIRYFHQAGGDNAAADHLPAFADGLIDDDLPTIAFNRWATALCRDNGYAG